jgi:hypothetical protein
MSRRSLRHLQPVDAEVLLQEVHMYAHVSSVVGSVHLRDVGKYGSVTPIVDR